MKTVSIGDPGVVRREIPPRWLSSTDPDTIRDANKAVG